MPKLSFLNQLHPARAKGDSPSLETVLLRRLDLAVDITTLSFLPCIVPDAYGDITISFNGTTDPPRPIFQLHLGKHEGDGDLWTVFSAKLTPINVSDEILPSSKIPVVVKMARPGLHRDALYMESEWARDEAYLYVGPLAQHGLVGSVVPSFYGLWRAVIPGTTDELLISILEHVGCPVSDQWSMIGQYWLPHIEELYRRLHATGLIHGELQVRHVRHRLDTDALCLIDFDRACAMDEGVREAEWFQLMDRLEPVRPTSDEEEDLDCEEKEEEGYTSW